MGNWTREVDRLEAWDVSVILQRAQGDVEEPEKNEKSARKITGDEWPSQFAPAENGQVSTQQQKHDRDGGDDEENADQEPQIAGLDYKLIALCTR